MGNAKWTLRRNGSASFEATIVSSDSNDAWLMWVNTLDSNGVVLGPIHHGGGGKWSRRPCRESHFRDTRCPQSGFRDRFGLPCLTRG
ncbi:DUF6294 family protein [Amycolatopsis sp. NPDC049868]|uniref:DUF6294 family protein n=1 Tax=Amycolatopsis sp. NPDC049868 TaxID=3363934 RepID=UPI0037A0BD01